jgi:hypothetical protein
MEGVECLPGLEPGSQPKHLGIGSVLPVAPQAHLSEPNKTPHHLKLQGGKGGRGMMDKSENMG